MEILFHAQDQRLTFRYFLLLVSPLPCDLYSRLHRLSTGVHWQDHVEAEKFRDELCKFGKDIVMERPGAERES